MTKNNKKVNKKLIITDKDVGAEYLESLKKIINIRKSRIKSYGYNVYEEPVDFYIWMIHSKYKRMMYIFNNINKNKYIYETLQDTIIDLINYSLFLLSKIGVKEK